MYGALAVGDVIITSPIISAFPMFTMLTALIFKQETITRKIVSGVCLVVGGIIMIGLGIAR